MASSKVRADFAVTMLDESGKYAAKEGTTLPAPFLSGYQSSINAARLAPTDILKFSCFIGYNSPI